MQSELDGRKDELISSRAVWSQRAEFPHPSDEAVQAVAKANQDLLDHSGRCVEAQKETSSASAVLQTAQQSFERQEEVVRAAHASVSDAQSNVEQAQALLAPSTRSLLHALRSHPDDSWKEHLAKVVHPDLLQREDLAPLMVGVEDASFYGWLIQTDAISMPDWADDSRLREALDSAQTLLGSAQAHLGLATEDLRTKSEDRLRAEDAAAQAVAALAVLESKLDGLSAAKDRAELALSKEKATLRDDAQAQVNKYAGQLGELTSQIASARSESSARLSSINSAHEKMRADALHVRNGALAQIDKAITGEQSKLRAHLESLEAQRLAHLGNHGVDVQKLQSLNDEANGISSQLLQIENHKPLVQAWRQFLEEGGEPVVQAAQRRAQDLLSKVGIQRQALADHESVMGASLESYRALSQRLGAQYQAIQDDLHGLQVLLQSFPSRPAHVPSTVTLDISVAQLKGRVSELRDAQEQAASVIRDECVHVRSRLTSSNKQLAQFVREWMGQYAAEEDSIVLQASALCQCHDRIGYEIVRPNNVELKTIFASIATLSNAIRTFETEVGRVNQQLQEGLGIVKCFERIQDLQLNIETSFEDLGFYKKLMRMSDVIRDYSQGSASRDERQPAPQEIASALADFASVLGSDGSLDINLGAFINLRGSVKDNGQTKLFRRPSELAHISSNGLTSIILITLMTALINTMRGDDPVYVPWVTDEIATFDAKNFRALMQMLSDNRIDVVTASPEIGPLQHPLFAQCYLFEDRGRIRVYQPQRSLIPNAAQPKPETA